MKFRRMCKFRNEKFNKILEEEMSLYVDGVVTDLDVVGGDIVGKAKAMLTGNELEVFLLELARYFIEMEAEYAKDE